LKKIPSFEIDIMCSCSRRGIGKYNMNTGKEIRLHGIAYSRVTIVTIMNLEYCTVLLLQMRSNKPRGATEEHREAEYGEAALHCL
jgi:hypothetical protein